MSHYICNLLHLPSRRAAKKPLLTPRHKELRVAFAKKYSAMPLENIRSILWSDEATFTVTGTCGGRVRRPVNSDRYEPRYTLKTKSPSFSDGMGRLLLSWSRQISVSGERCYHERS